MRAPRARNDAAVNHNPESTFDFTKPYEPAPDATPRVVPPLQLPGRGRPHRPTAALLGGAPAAHHKRK